MFNCTIIALLFAAFPLLSYGQLFGEFRHQREVKDIIFNQQQFGIERFTIKLERSTNDRRIWKKKFHYQFMNDSTLQVREGLLLEQYTIRDNDILEPTFQPDSSWLTEYNKDKIYSQSIIDGFETHRIYQFTETDTVLIQEDAIKREENTTTRINKYFVGTDWRVHKSVATQLSDSSSNISHFDYVNDTWCKRYEIIETKITINERQFIRQKRDRRFDCGPNGFGELIDASFLQHSFTFSYSKEGWLDAIEISSSDKHFPEKIRLIVQRKRPKYSKK